jgi:hypothetical protein
MTITYTSIFHCKALQNLPKLGILVWKQTIWKPWRHERFRFRRASPTPSHEDAARLNEDNGGAKKGGKKLDEETKQVEPIESNVARGGINASLP